MLDKLMERGAQDIVETVIDRAKGGDMTAARLILERLVPPAKERPIAIELPPTSDAQGVADAQALVIAAPWFRGLLPGDDLRRMLGLMLIPQAGNVPFPLVA